MLNRLLELRDEVCRFSLEHPYGVFRKFREKEWLQRLAYLANIFIKLNELNLSLQGKQIDFFKVVEKIDAMKRNLGIWSELVSVRNPDRNVCDSSRTFRGNWFNPGDFREE